MSLIFDKKANKLKFNDGRELEDLCILVDGDLLLSYGDSNIIKDKYEMLYRAFKYKQLDVSSLYLMNVSNIVELKDCPFVLEYLLSATSSGRVTEFVKRFMTGQIYPWLDVIRDHK